MKRRLVFLSLIASMCLPMVADDAPLPLEWHGYFRGGDGTSSAGGTMNAFWLPGQITKYRLGNEAENYGELEFGSTLYKKDGVEFKVHTMAQFWAGYNQGQAGTYVYATPGTFRQELAMSQYWAEAKGIFGDSAPMKDASLWAGRRYYNRHHVEITDFFYWTNQGMGIGLENVNLGFAKLAYAYIQTENNNTLGAASAAVPTNYNNAVGTHSLRLDGIQTNTNGTLSLGVQFDMAKPVTASTDASNNNGGSSFHLEHNQDKVLGGNNTFYLGYGTGAASNMNGLGWGAGTQPNPGLASSCKTTRVVDTLTLEVAKAYSVQIAGYYQNAKDASGSATVNTSIGARNYFYATKNFSVVAEVGLDQVKYASDYASGYSVASGNTAAQVAAATATAGQTGSLVKSTLAFVWKPEPTIWSVPELRLFVTNGNWNTAANTAGMASGGYTNGSFVGKTTGTNIGFQANLWW